MESIGAFRFQTGGQSFLWPQRTEFARTFISFFCFFGFRSWVFTTTKTTATVTATTTATATATATTATGMTATSTTTAATAGVMTHAAAAGAFADHHAAEHDGLGLLAVRWLETGHRLSRNFAFDEALDVAQKAVLVDADQ